jgi:ribosomal protein S27AE
VESNLNQPNDVTELLRKAGARACARCGVQSLVPAHDSDAVVWFCFECGYQEPRHLSPISQPVD